MKYRLNKSERLKKIGLSLTKKHIYFSLLGCWLFPFFLLASNAIDGGKDLSLMLFPILTSAGGSWLLLQLWEKKMQRSVAKIVQTKMDQMGKSSAIDAGALSHYQDEITRLASELEASKVSHEHQVNLMQSSVAKSKEETRLLHLEMEKKLEEIRLAYLEFEDLRKEYKRLEEDTACVLSESQKDIQHKDSLIAEYQKTISEQRMILEKKQRYIAKLEGKVRDLMYEIRSLLQLEVPRKELQALHIEDEKLLDKFLFTPLAKTPYDYSVQLHRCVENAENLTGSDHLGLRKSEPPRFLELSPDSYTIDRRRFFDHLKDETGGDVFVYSLVERKFAFVHPSIKTIIGWGHEKFIKEFASLVANGYKEWNEALSKIKMVREAAVRLSIYQKSGASKIFDCYMNKVSKGPFAQHVIGIFVPTTHNEKVS
jgi:hypothetical protein